MRIFFSLALASQVLLLLVDASFGLMFITAVQFGFAAAGAMSGSADRRTQQPA